MAEQDWLTPATAPAPSPYQNVVAAPMVGPPAYELRPLTLGELLDRTFSLFRSRFWLFTGIASTAASVELIVAGIGRVIVHRYTQEPQGLYTASLGVTYVASFIYFFFYCVTQAATCFAMSEVYLNRQASIGSSLRAVRGKWYAWIGIAMWQGWSAAWPFLALFIPLIILATLKFAFASIGGGFLIFGVVAALGAMVYGAIAYIRNSLAIPAKVVEGMTVRKAMRRSKDLSNGAKGRIFVLGLIVWALFMVAAMLQAPFAMMTMMARSSSHVFSEMATLVIMFVARSVVTPIGSIGICLIYFDQRVRREAFDLEVLLGPEQAATLPASPEFPPDSAPPAEAEPHAPWSNLKLLSGLATALLLLGSVRASAQSIKIGTTAKFQKVSAQDYRAHLAAMQALVQSCMASAAACDPDKVGADERIEAPSAQTFQVRWQWLRDTLDQSRKAKPEQRVQSMQQASARVAEMVRENGQPPRQTQFAVARRDADRILASSEFSDVERQSWLDRMIARFWAWVNRWLTSFAGLSTAAPWIGRLLEWLLFGSAAVGLLLFVRRAMQRQRLAVAFNSQTSELTWARESNDWAAQAETSARAGDWRDAVHCLYWATIVMLEGRRAWRHNPARTPREYVRLLKPGSAQQGALRGLTQIFERLWYGLRDASATDYERARSFYENLRENKTAGAA